MFLLGYDRRRELKERAARVAQRMHPLHMSMQILGTGAHRYRYIDILGHTSQLSQTNHHICLTYFDEFKMQSPQCGIDIAKMSRNLCTARLQSQIENRIGI